MVESDCLISKLTSSTIIHWIPCINHAIYTCAFVHASLLLEYMLPLFSLTKLPQHFVPITIIVLFHCVVIVCVYFSHYTICASWSLRLCHICLWSSSVHSGETWERYVMEAKGLESSKKGGTNHQCQVLRRDQVNDSWFWIFFFK